jgi:hypothetical protein
MLQVVVFSATLTLCCVDALTDVSGLQILFRQVMLLHQFRPALRTFTELWLRMGGS